MPNDQESKKPEVTQAELQDTKWQDSLKPKFRGSNIWNISW